MVDASLSPPSPGHPLHLDPRQAHKLLNAELGLAMEVRNAETAFNIISTTAGVSETRVGPDKTGEFQFSILAAGNYSHHYSYKVQYKV